MSYFAVFADGQFQGLYKREWQAQRLVDKFMDFNINYHHLPRVSSPAATLPHSMIYKHYCMVKIVCPLAHRGQFTHYWTILIWGDLA